MGAQKAITSRLILEWRNVFRIKKSLHIGPVFLVLYKFDLIILRMQKNFSLKWQVKIVTFRTCQTQASLSHQKYRAIAENYKEVLKEIVVPNGRNNPLIRPT